MNLTNPQKRFNTIKESFENKIDQAINQHKGWARTAPKGYEIATIGRSGKKFTGNRDSVQISFDLNDKNINGFISHTHPTKGQPTPLGCLPSAEDLESCIQFMTGATSQDKDHNHGNQIINDPSNIEGSIIWHGNYYCAFIPTEKVNLNTVPQYLNRLKEGDYTKALQLLTNMGFIVKTGSV